LTDLPDFIGNFLATRIVYTATFPAGAIDWLGKKPPDEVLVAFPLNHVRVSGFCQGEEVLIRLFRFFRNNLFKQIFPYSVYPVIETTT
jgi:hypothetical protein